MSDSREIIFYLDIETIPGQHPSVLAALQNEADAAKAQIKAPSNYKDEAKIAEYILGKQADIDAEVELKWRKTSFDGAYGQIVAISVATNNDAPVNLFFRDWENAEHDLIAELYRTLRSAYSPSTQQPPIFVGHNIVSFDFRFLLQRSMLLDIEPPPFIPFKVKPWDERVYDTMTEWAGFGNRVSLDKLCRIFGIPTKGTEIDDEIDGSLVWDYVREGRIQDVALYCGGDVERVRMLHKKMTFAGGRQT